MNKRGIFWLIILIVFVLLLIIAGFLAYYFTQPRVVYKEELNSLSCNDPDGKDIYTAATSYYVYYEEEERENSQVNSPDWCEYNFHGAKERVGLIREAVCKDGKFIDLFMTCGLGYVCRHGKCIKGDESLPICYDSDSGKNQKQKGDIEGYGGSGTDTCIIKYSPELDAERYSTTDCNGTNCYLEEWYCEGDWKKFDQLPCLSGCKEGVC